MSPAVASNAPEALGLLLRPGSSAPAFISPESGEVLTHGRLAERVDALAGRLAAAGVRRGDRVRSP